MIRSWSGPYSVALEHDPPVSRWTSPSVQRMNRRVIRHGLRCIAVQSACDDPLVGVGLLNDLAMIQYWPLPHQMISGVDGCLLHQWRVVWWWWQNNQRPVHLMVTKLHPIFTMYLLINFVTIGLYHYTSFIISTTKNTCYNNSRH
jgi:hypothetical protein